MKVLNSVEAWVFDLEDTTRTVWSMKVPAELSSFTAQVGNGPGVTLNWKTGSEINNAGFNVQRGRSQIIKYLPFFRQKNSPNNQC